MPVIERRRTQKRLAAAIVLHKGHVLLVRRSYTERFLPGAWGVPCGKLEAGESPADGVLRELKEETGLLGHVRRAVGRSFFDSEWDGRAVENIQTNFVVELDTDEDPGDIPVSLPEPDQAHQWVPIADLSRADLDDHNLNAIRQAL